MKNYSKGEAQGRAAAIGVQEHIRKMSSEEDMVAWLHSTGASSLVDHAIGMHRRAQSDRVAEQRMRRKVTSKYITKPAIVGRIRQREHGERTRTMQAAKRAAWVAEGDRQIAQMEREIAAMERKDAARKWYQFWL